MPDSALLKAPTLKVVNPVYELRITVFFTRLVTDGGRAGETLRYPEFRVEFDRLDPTCGISATCTVQGEFGLHTLIGSLIKMALDLGRHVRLEDRSNGYSNLIALYSRNGWEWLGHE